MSFLKKLFGGNSVSTTAEEQTDFRTTSGSFTDARDGTVYSWAKIGSKIWMTENLRFKCKKACWSPKDFGNAGYMYGRLALNEACLKGWRIPTKNDYTKLINLYGGEEKAGTRLRKGGDSGFNAIPFGRRYDDGEFTNEEDAYFWTITEDNEGLAWFIRVEEKKARIVETWDTGLKMGMGTSIRCIKD